MAGFSLWQRVARLWPRGRSTAGARRRRPRSPLWLEQLGDRTLLSGFGLAYDLHFLIVHADLGSLHWPEAVQPVPPAAAIEDFRLLTGVLRKFAAQDLSNPMPLPDLQGAGLDASPADANGSGGLPDAAGSYVGFRKAPTELNMEGSSYDSSLEEQLQQVLVTRVNATTIAGLEEYGKAFLTQEHTLSDRTVLAYLLRPYGAEHPDPHSAAGDGGNSFGGTDEGPARPDGSGTEFLLSDRTDGPGIARSLAAVFREELPGNEGFGENPAGKTPDVLVSYEPDLLAPRAELLPLEDGSRALVAALVAGVPEKDVAPAGPTEREAALTGSPVGIDGGLPAAAVPVPAESGVPEGPTDLAPQTGLPTTGPTASDAAAGLPPTDPGPGDARANRLTVRLVDAVFAAGVFSLYYLADDFGERIRRHGRPR